jgi:hypothetical protein
VVHNLISAAEKVADEQAFIRLLQLMALDLSDERQKEVGEAIITILSGSKRLGKRLDWAIPGGCSSLGRGYIVHRQFRVADIRCLAPRSNDYPRGSVL